MSSLKILDPKQYQGKDTTDATTQPESNPKEILLASLILQLDSLQESKKESDKKFNDEINTLEQEIYALALEISSGQQTLFEDKEKNESS